MDNINLDDVKDLLNKIDSALVEYYTKMVSRDHWYNIFQVLEVSHMEVIMCRMLKDLLDPNGAHGEGACFLKLFLEEVLGLTEFSENDMKNAKVYKEYLIPKSTKRIDIVIAIGNRFIPIEAKINAKDQENQCIDYYLYAKNVMQDEDAEIYYLTKYGTEPSKVSISKKGHSVPSDRLKTLSFEKDIRKWLKKCVELEIGETVKLMLEHYLTALEDLTNAVEDEVGENMEKLLLECPANFRAGIMIEKTMESAKISLLQEIFTVLELEMDKMIVNLPFSVSKLPWKKYDEVLPDYYSSKKDVYPGISYKIDHTKITGTKHIQLRIEAEDILYAGLTVFDTKLDNGNGDEVFPLSKADKEKVRKYLEIDELDDESLQVKWIYLPTGTMEESDTVPDFRTMNQAAIDLVDSEKREEFVEKSVKAIKEHLMDAVIL